MTLDVKVYAKMMNVLLELFYQPAQVYIVRLADPIGTLRSLFLLICACVCACLVTRAHKTTEEAGIVRAYNCMKGHTRPNR